ncbi:MAG TPA: hypothetical protein VFZ53_23935 [Polyangiaceae bacterium]
MGLGFEPGLPAEAPELDPLELTLSAPPGALTTTLSQCAPAVSSLAGPAGVPAEVVLSAGLIRRVVWGGDRRRGIARIELDGTFAGTSIWLTGEGRSLNLEVVLGPGLEGNRLVERLLARLGARGIAVASCEVR